jgi:SAM-dependent methyltransferase
MAPSFFRSGYRAHLVGDWIAALEGVEEKLERGGRVADVGCGHGASTIIMAQAYPASVYVGFDYHDASIERAREVAREAAASDRSGSKPPARMTTRAQSSISSAPSIAYTTWATVSGWRTTSQSSTRVGGSRRLSPA